MKTLNLVEVEVFCSGEGDGGQVDHCQDEETTGAD